MAENITKFIRRIFIMSMKKVLAAGIAATLAVSSLAAVASAEETRSYDMITTYGTVVYKPTVTKGAEAIDPGDDYDFVGDSSTGTSIYRTFAVADGVSGNATANGVTQAQTNTPESLQDTNGDGVVNELDYDMFIPFRVTGSFADMLKYIDSMSVTIKGKKIASNGATTVDLTQTAKLVKVTSVNGDTTINYILPIYNNGGPVSGAFVPERFVQVDEISFTATPSNKTAAFSGLDQADYTTLTTQKDDDGNLAPWKVALAYDAADNTVQAFDNNGAIVAPWVVGWTQGGCQACNITVRLADAFVADANGNDTANVLYTVDTYASGVITGTGFTVVDASDTASGTAAAAGDLSGGLLMSKIRSMLQVGVNISLQADYGACYTTDTPAWLPYTDRSGVIGTYNAGSNTWSGGLLERNDIWRLSDTGDWASRGQNSGYAVAQWNGPSEGVNDNQTYTVVDYNKGTVPRGFSGLASQVADFFNKQSNGKIEFVFDSYAPAAAANTWKNGGIPSTEVGLRNFIEAAQVKDFALFFNYNATTGSLQSNATLDESTGSVIFDITDVLGDVGGLTKGTIQDIYYGLGRGVCYSDNKTLLGGTIGIYVSKVILSYDPDTKVSGDTATKDDEKEEEVKADDKGDVVEAPVDEPEIPDDTNDDDDDEGDVIVADEPDDTSAEVDNTVDDDATVVVTPTNNTPAPEADENPHTGVALAVVPMIAAAAAMVISKKRK